MIPQMRMFTPEIDRWCAILIVLLAAATAGPAYGADANGGAGELPVVTSHYGDRTKLNAERKRLLLEAARPLTPEGRSAWFLSIDFISDYECWARFFFTPDETSPRLRKGQCADIHLGRNSKIVKKEGGGVEVVFLAGTKVTASRL
jgi:hypothetical protein